MLCEFDVIINGVQVQGLFSKEKYFKWHLFIPIFLLFFSYVFGVAVELLGEYQLFVRVSALAFCIVCSLWLKINFSLQSSIVLVFFLIYALVLYLINGGPILLNFIYLAILLFYFYSLGASREAMLFHSLVASYLVILLYLIYLVVGGVSFEPVTIGDRTRYYFGFTNPNKVGIVAYSVVLLSSLYFLRKNKIVLLAVGIPFIAVAVYSGSRTAMYALIVFFGMAGLSLLVSFKRLIFLIPLVFLLGSFYVSTLNNNEFANLLLSNRPIDYHAFVSVLDAYDFILGANSDGYRVDNSFILAYFAVGPLGVLLFVCLIFRLRHDGFSGLELSFILSILAYGLMEGVLVRVEFPIVIYFYYLIVGRSTLFDRNNSFAKLDI